LAAPFQLAILWKKHAKALIPPLPQSSSPLKGKAFVSTLPVLKALVFNDISPEDVILTFPDSAPYSPTANSPIAPTFMNPTAPLKRPSKPKRSTLTLRFLHHTPARSPFQRMGVRNAG